MRGVSKKGSIDKTQRSGSRVNENAVGGKMRNGRSKSNSKNQILTGVTTPSHQVIVNLTNFSKNQDTSVTAILTEKASPQKAI